MSYFRELPNLEYQSFLSDRKASDEYLTVKNLFRRVKLRDDLQNVFTIFDKYQIMDGARPETVAEELYGSTQYDWVVLISAGITRVRDQWPLSDKDVYDYAEEIYGTNLNGVHHYETTEVKDSKNRLILPAGKVVDSTFTIPNPSNPLATLNPVTGVSNYEYEIVKNNKKRTIYVLKPRYLQQVVTDTRKAMTYDKSSQYVSNKVIKTENTRASNP
jgi:Base plate wedge protein 53